MLSKAAQEKVLASKARAAARDAKLVAARAALAAEAAKAAKVYGKAREERLPAFLHNVFIHGSDEARKAGAVVAKLEAAAATYHNTFLKVAR